MSPTAVLLDVDGTLVDSNDAHAHAWVAAFAEAGLEIPFDRVRRCIGMGADKLLPSVAGLGEDDPAGKEISRRRGEIFRQEWVPRLKPQRDADRLLQALKERGFRLVAASSAKRSELTQLLDVAGASWLLDDHTSSDDANASKPEPDIVMAALTRGRVQPRDALMVGDTPYDIEACRTAGIRIFALRCGGYWSDEDLRDATAVFDHPAALLEHWRV